MPATLARPFLPFALEGTSAVALGSRAQAAELIKEERGDGSIAYRLAPAAMAAAGSSNNVKDMGE